jgi:hypothetical protein
MQDGIRDQYILDNSVERVINTTLRILEEIKTKVPHGSHLSELVWQNQSDWLECQQVVVDLWNIERNAIFKGGPR